MTQFTSLFGVSDLVFWMAKKSKKEQVHKQNGHPEASVYVVRNHLCYHFAVYPMNESCSNDFQEG